MSEPQQPERARARDLALLGVWLIALVLALVIGRPKVAVGELEALVPAADRSVRGEPWLLLRVDPNHVAAPTEGTPDADGSEPESERADEDLLIEAGIALEEALGHERVALAPPRSEIERWLDAHALYLLPVDAHEALAAKLADATMLAEVQGLEARMSSPLFATLPDQPRRDPLDLHTLTERSVGSFGHVDALEGARVTASGDLLANEGERLLVQLRSQRSPAQLRATIEAALVGRGVTFDLLGPEVRAEQAEQRLHAVARPLVLACFAALVLVLALVLRRIVPVLALIACLASGALMIAAALGSLVGSLDLFGLALLVLLLGFACDAALVLPKIGLRGWASQLVLASALLPLLASPHPLWQRWAIAWLLGYLALALILRGVLPAILRRLATSGPAWLGHDLDWRLPGFRLKPMPIVALLSCVALCGGGAWASGRLEHRPAHLIPLGLVELDAREAELRAAFFDPALIVEARTQGADPAAALDASSADAAALAGLVGDRARRVDSPGSFVLGKQELDARRKSLATLALPERMTALHDMLDDQGLRAEAFSEFVRGAADLGDLPSAQAALEGPLGPWITRYLSDDGRSIRTRVELRGEASIPLAIDEDTLASVPELHGPAIAAIRDQREFDARLGLIVVIGLWLIAFWVWVGTGSLVMAVAVALVALAGECGLLLALELLGQPIGAHLLPVLILVGAATGVAAGRACRSVALDQPLVARGLLLSGLCQVVVALALASSGLPIWRELGLAAALGCMLAAGLGLFVGPGIAGLMVKRERSA